MGGSLLLNGSGFFIDMSPFNSSKFSYGSILIATLFFSFAVLWIVSFQPFRLKVGDYFFNQGRFDQAIDWYGKVLRKEKLKGFLIEPSQGQPYASERKEAFIKYSKACLNSAEFHFDQGGKYSSSDPNRAEAEFGEVFRLYKLFIRNLSYDLIGEELNVRQMGVTADLFGIVKKAYTGLGEIYKLKQPRKVLELYAALLELENLSGDSSFEAQIASIFPSAVGVNLLDNPYFVDSNNNGVPDGYTLACVGPKSSCPRREIIKLGEFNTYHVWQQGGNGWAATSFQIGRVPPNMFFTYSIEIKRIDTKGEVRPMLFTNRKSNPAWGSGSEYSEIGIVEDLGDGWKREIHRIKTNNNTDILLSGWIAAWGYGQAEGHIYVRKPKVEIMDRASSWNN